MTSLYEQDRHRGGVYFNRSKPWKARAKRDGVEIFLGWYTTKEEALDAERTFTIYHPRQRPPR